MVGRWPTIRHSFYTLHSTSSHQLELEIGRYAHKSCANLRFSFKDIFVAFQGFLWVRQALKIRAWLRGSCFSTIHSDVMGNSDISTLFPMPLYPSQGFHTPVIQLIHKSHTLSYFLLPSDVALTTSTLSIGVPSTS